MHPASQAHCHSKLTSVAAADQSSLLAAPDGGDGGTDGIATGSGAFAATATPRVTGMSACVAGRPVATGVCTA